MVWEKETFRGTEDKEPFRETSTVAVDRRWGKPEVNVISKAP